MGTSAPRVATAVAAAIEASDLTMLEVIDRTGIPRTTLYRRLRGTDSGFTVAELESLGRVLEVDPADFLRTPESVAS